MADLVKGKSLEVKVPSSVELGKKVNEEKAQKQKGNKKRGVFLVIAAAAVVLFVIIVFALFFLAPAHKYSFNINGVTYVSDSFTPSAFFPQFKDNNSFLIVADLKEGQGNSWVVNAMNLWLVALNADHKNVQSLVRLSDASGAPKSCATNDANILSSRDLSLAQCAAMIGDSSKAKVLLSLSNSNTAVLSPNQIELFASGASTVSQVNYFAIKEMYPDFDKTLALVNEKINSIKQ